MKSEKSISKQSSDITEKGEPEKIKTRVVLNIKTFRIKGKYLTENI